MLLKLYYMNKKRTKLYQCVPVGEQPNKTIKRRIGQHIDLKLLYSHSFQVWCVCTLLQHLLF